MPGPEPAHRRRPAPRHFHVCRLSTSMRTTGTKQGLVIDQGDGDGGRRQRRSSASRSGNVRPVKPLPANTGRSSPPPASMDRASVSTPARPSPGMAVRAPNGMKTVTRKCSRWVRLSAIRERSGAFTHAGQAPAEPGRGRIRSQPLEWLGQWPRLRQGQARPRPVEVEAAHPVPRPPCPAHCQHYCTIRETATCCPVESPIVSGFAAVDFKLPRCMPSMSAGMSLSRGRGVTIPSSWTPLDHALGVD